MRAFGYLSVISGSEKSIEVNFDRLCEILKPMIVSISFDEDWYRTYYHDVDAAIEAGSFKSGKQHYVKSGYFEDRLPRFVTVDEIWYLQQYADVSIAIGTGSIASAQDHFIANGFREGRQPHEGWALLSDSPGSLAYEQRPPKIGKQR